MRCSDQDITGARRLQDLGFPWQPQPGHFVWAAAHVITAPSPFQERVYCILDLQHFLRRVGSIEALQATMLWLPTWHDARAILQGLGVSAQTVASALQEHAALQQGTALETLYQLIATQLQHTGQGVKTPPVPSAAG